MYVPVKHNAHPTARLAETIGRPHDRTPPPSLTIHVLEDGHVLDMDELRDIVERRRLGVAS